MKILLADSFPPTHIDLLKSQGHSTSSHADLDENTLPAAITDHEILIVRSTKVTAQTLAQADSLKLVIRAGAGTNTIDKSHAAQMGIAVANVPGANALAVAELTMGLIIAIDRKLADNVADLRNTIWNKKKYCKAQGLYGKNIGILGMGAVGLAVAIRAHAFGMNVYAVNSDRRSVDTMIQMTKVGVRSLVDQNDVLALCDIISVHVPYSEQTKNMVNAEFLSNMKEGAMLINTSRGELVDEVALIEAMNQRGIRAGLDVYQNEPGAGDNAFISELAQHAALVGTHHIGASTEQAQIAVADGVLAVIASYQDHNLINQVN